MDIKGKTALVTGSGKGIGRSIALELAQKGANVIINYLNDEDQASQTVDLIKQLNVKVKAYKADIGDSDSVKRLKENILKDFGAIDILVNNAGVIRRPGSWNEISDQDTDITINTNLKGVLYCMKEFVPILVSQKDGAIINITSTYSITVASGVLAYTAAKAGVISITRSMARELGKFGISVNAIAPGNIDTDMTKEAGDGFKKWVEETSPIPRLGTPNEIAKSAVFLIESTYITGHVLIVDGGHILNM